MESWWPLSDVVWVGWLWIAVVVLASVLAAIHALLWKRDPRSALAWIVLCLLFPAVGPLLYFLLGINRIRTQARALLDRGALESHALESHALQSHAPGQPAESPGGVSPHAAQVPPELVAVARTADALSRHPLIGGNAVGILHDGEETFPAMVAAIDAAERRVELSTYIYESNTSGKLLADAMARAVTRGVDVRVLLDGYGELYAWPPAGRLLRSRDVRIERFLPPALAPRMWHFNLRNHRKILTVDGRVGFAGGINIGDRHLAATDNPRRVEDIHFRFAGPVVRQLEAIFAEDWTFVTGEHLEPSPSPSPVGQVACRAIPDGPNQDLDRLATLLVGAVSAAHRQVMVVTPYFLPSRELVAALESAALRGVEVVVLVPGKNNLPYVRWASRNMYWELLERGVRIYEQPAPFVHTKLFLVDASYALVGSFNLDPRSLRLNFELGVEIYDRATAEALQVDCESCRQRSREVTLEEVDSRGLGERVRDGLAWLASPYL